MSDGMVNFCKECKKERIKNNPNRFRNEKKRNQNPKRKQYIQKTSEQWYLKYPERKKAHAKLNNAIRDGKIKKEFCFVCGKKAHAHHPDYSQPLKVIWLCPRHHKLLHHNLIFIPF